MNISIKDSLRLSAEDNLKLVRSLLDNSKPKEGSFDYEFETHRAIGIVVGIKLTHLIQVYQSNKRKFEKSSIVITIKKHILRKLLLILFLTISNVLISGGPCPPFSPCWCANNPNHRKCKQVGVPINGGIEFLALGGLLLSIYFYKKQK